MMDNITTFLQWLVPVLGTAIVWLTNRTLRNTRTVKEVHDTYKTMYEDQPETLIELQDENGNLYQEVSRLKQVVLRASVCRYWAVCPLRPELQDTKGNVRGKADRKPAGQPTIRNPGSEAGDGSPVGSGFGNTCGKPP